MITTFARYSILFVLTVLILIALSLILAHLFPGDIITNLSGVTPSSPQQREELVQIWALEANPFLHYINYCKLLLTGDWGVSSVSGNALLAEMGTTLPATVELSIYATFIAIIIGVPFGCLAGIKSYSKIDYSINGIAIMQYSLPVFWLALAFILIFCLQLNWLPLSGRISVLYEIPHQTGFIVLDILLADDVNKRGALANVLAHMLLPSLAIGLISGAALTRLIRRTVIDVLNKPFIAAARSRGLSSSTIFFDHVLRNALLPVLPLVAIQVTTLITNAMIVETLFSWPGIGNWLLQAIYQQDYSALRIGMLVVSVMVISITVLVELLNRLIDPRKGEKTYAKL
jgi:cationic peptide transport system permease protein